MVTDQSPSPAVVGAVLCLDVVFCVWGVVLARTDLREHRLPRRLTVPAYPVLGALGVAVWVGAAWMPAAEASEARTRVVAAALGAVTLRLLYRAVRALSPGGVGLGRGDVTLSAPVGAWLGVHGPHAVWWGAWAGFAVTGTVALALLAARRADRRTHVPHGPGMVAGALLAAAIAGW